MGDRHTKTNKSYNISSYKTLKSNPSNLIRIKLYYLLCSDMYGNNYGDVTVRTTKHLKSLTSQRKNLKRTA